jgi:hypothetical protein
LDCACHSHRELCVQLSFKEGRPKHIASSFFNCDRADRRDTTARRRLSL